MNRFIHWLDARFPLLSTWKAYASAYYVPKNLNGYYVFGSLALLVLFIQLISGLWLTMFYTPTVSGAFRSIEYIMRDVSCGWFLRYLHSTGASFFFIILYVHIFRGLLYGSYQKPRELVWLFGVFLFLMLIIEAFFGYLLPWGQLSYWGAQVITSLFGSLPFVGDSVLLWLRGDYLVGDATLHRFFALHVVGVPLLFCLFVFLHIVSLHAVGSNNPQGIDIDKYLDKQGNPLDGVPFAPYYVVKDLLAMVLFLIVFFSVVFFFPEMGGYFLEPANFSKANPWVTPEHNTPVWYMTPFYAMLRVIPNTLLGFFVLVSSVFFLFFMPWLDKSPVRAMRYKGRYSKAMLLAFVLSFCLLSLLGMMELTSLRVYLARFCVMIYFAYFLLMPYYTRYERCHDVPERITT